MDQQELSLTPVPTGEASYRHDPADTTEGTYFALSYRGKRVCIDSGLLAVVENFKGLPMDRRTRDSIDKGISDFLKDYPKVWWKNHRTNEELEIVEVTCSYVKMNESPHDYGTPLSPSRSYSHMELVLSPHYKVPNDQSMGSAPIHVD
jgi:hypothetical protein